MPRLISFQKLGIAHNSPRWWVEGSRLIDLGFSPGTPIKVEVKPSGFIITPSTSSDRIVSFRRSAGQRKPIIDLNSHRLLSHLASFDEMKATGSFGQLSVEPSIRAFNIARSKQHSGPFRVVDLFAGGGTLSDAIAGNPHFRVIAGVEIDSDYADVYAKKHPNAELFHGNFRSISPEELPEHEIIIGGIPCNDHSNQGRSSKKLAGKPECGEFGDLYIPVLALVASRTPAACVFENVPNYRSSIAGKTLIAQLNRLGYSVCETIIKPNTEWAEPTARNRWVCIATLRPGFALRVPGIQFTGRISDYLDAPDAARDRKEAQSIARTIAGLRRHNTRHTAAGHGFSMTILDGSEQSAPVIPKSYHKINSSGFFVQTDFGPRKLRLNEIAGLHGCERPPKTLQKRPLRFHHRGRQDFTTYVGGF